MKNHTELFLSYLFYNKRVEHGETSSSNLKILIFLFFKKLYMMIKFETLE